MKYFLLFTILFYSLDLMGQPDTIVAYNVRNQTIELIPPVAYDRTINFDSTSFSTGEMGRKVPLDFDPPVINLVEGTQFTDIARTAVKLFAWNNIMSYSENNKEP